jgi:hypothetical protein
VRIFFIVMLFIFLTHNSIASEPYYFLVGSVNNNIPCKQKTFFLKKGDSLKLYLIVQFDNKFIAPIDSFLSGGALLKTTKVSSQPINISWYVVQPQLQEYSNLWSREDKNEGYIHVEPVDYERKPIKGATNCLLLDFASIVGMNNFGTYYVAAEVNTKEGTGNQVKPFFSEASPLNHKYPFKVIQIVYRKDDTYIGYLTELLNTPFIIAPMLTGGDCHETDCRMGSDCAAFAIYGKRRQGYKIPYCGPKWIYKYLTEIKKGALWPKKAFGTEIYINKDDQFVKAGIDGITAGDIVHFGEQVSVFYQDSGVKGLLDKDDLLFQCYKDAPHITTIEKSGFYHKPIRVFKWKEATRQ